VTPMIWIGGSCGVVTDALPETRLGDEAECDYCGDGCVQVAAEATEYEIDDPSEDLDGEPSDADLEIECAFLADAERELAEDLGPIDAAGRVWEDPE
jgi:hypothetical protein